MKQPNLCPEKVIKPSPPPKPLPKVQQYERATKDQSLTPEIILDKMDISYEEYMNNPVIHYLVEYLIGGYDPIILLGNLIKEFEKIGKDVKDVALVNLINNV